MNEDGKNFSVGALVVMLGLGFLATQFVRCNRDDDALKMRVRVECIHSGLRGAECTQLGGQ